MFLNFQFDQAPYGAVRSIKGKIEIDFCKGKFSQAVVGCFAARTFENPLRLAVETSKNAAFSLGVKGKAREVRRIDLGVAQPVH